jgi:hypothetical protein
MKRPIMVGTDLTEASDEACGTAVSMESAAKHVIRLSGETQT